MLKYVSVFVKGIIIYNTVYCAKLSLYNCYIFLHAAKGKTG